MLGLYCCLQALPTTKAKFHFGETSFNDFMKHNFLENQRLPYSALPKGQIEFSSFEGKLNRLLMKQQLTKAELLVVYTQFNK